jgi:signal transduction histidine kinase
MKLYLTSLLLLLLLPRAVAQRTDTAVIMQMARSAAAAETDSPRYAERLLRTTLAASREAVFAKGVSYSLQHLGNVYAALGAFDTCLAVYRDALLFAEGKTEMRTVLPVIYNGMGNVYKLQGRYEEASGVYYKAAAMAEQLDMPGISTVYNNMAAVLMFLKQYDKCLFYLDKSARRSLQLKDYETLACVYTNRGLVYKAMKRRPDAERSFRDALSLTGKHGLLQVRYNTLINLGQLCLETGRPQAALRYLLQTQDIAGNINPAYRVNALEVTGETYTALGNNQQAIAYLQRALEMATALQLDENILTTEDRLARAFAGTGQYEQAYRHLLAYTVMKDSISDQQVTHTISQLDVKYRMAQRDKEIAQKQLLLSNQESYLRRKNIWIGGISVSAVLLSGLLLVWVRSNRRRQHLQQKQIQLLQQEQQILRREQEIGQLKAMMQGEEKERTRISRELHDGIGGMLTAINMNIRAVQKRQRDTPLVRELDAIIGMLQDMAIDVRNTAHNLMPDILLRHNLREALHLYCEQIDQTDLHISMQFYGAVDTLDKTLALALYRMIQELVQNVIRHAGATETEIQVRLDNDLLSVSVEDNGSGFDTTQLGSGLENIRSRVEGLQGYFSVASAAGIGTTAYIELPLQQLKKLLAYDTYSHS